jgi:redox-sensitive bicupin YhaK (pirin superfamily)
MQQGKGECMITIRKSNERGATQVDWLDSRHTFSFNDYYDPDHIGFRTLRVINDDRVAPAAGFGTHPHRDMEIVTYVLSGSLAHKDSLGASSEIQRGEVQRMTAGTGIRHSEFNGSKTEPAHFLQIWIVPEKKGLHPEYEQREFADGEKQGRFRLVASHDGRDQSLTIHQDVDLFAALIAPGQRLVHSLRPGRHAWVQVATGTVSLSGQLLTAGDGAAATDEQQLELTGIDKAEVLLFDLS